MNLYCIYQYHKVLQHISNIYVIAVVQRLSFGFTSFALLQVSLVNSVLNEASSNKSFGDTNTASFGHNYLA